MTKEVTLEQALVTTVDKLTAAMQMVAEKTVAVAPQAMELTLKALQLQAGMYVVFLLVSMAITIYAAVFTFKFGKSEAEEYERRFKQADSSPLVFSCLLGVLPLSLLSLHILSIILSSDGLIMLISPEAGLALKVLSAAGLN